MGCRRLRYRGDVSAHWLPAVPMDEVYERAFEAGARAFADGYHARVVEVRDEDGGGFLCGWRTACAAIAEVMLAELAMSRLDVVAVVPPDRANGIRVVAERNVDWYRDLCASCPSHARSHGRRWRKVDTMIKRAHVVRALHELAAGRCATMYAWRLVPFAQAYAAGRYGADGCEPSAVDRSATVMAFADGAGEAF